MYVSDSEKKFRRSHLRLKSSVNILTHVPGEKVLPTYARHGEVWDSTAPRRRRRPAGVQGLGVAAWRPLVTRDRQPAAALHSVSATGYHCYASGYHIARQISAKKQLSCYDLSLIPWFGPLFVVEKGAVCLCRIFSSRSRRRVCTVSRQRLRILVQLRININAMYTTEKYCLVSHVSSCWNGQP